MNSGKVVLGVLAGLAAGAVMGILFAPDKGSNTRKKISRKGIDYAGEIEDKFNELLDNLNEKFDAAKGEADDLVDKAKGKVNDVKNGVHSKLEPQG